MMDNVYGETDSLQPKGMGGKPFDKICYYSLLVIACILGVLAMTAILIIGIFDKPSSESTYTLDDTLNPALLAQFSSAKFVGNEGKFITYYKYLDENETTCDLVVMNTADKKEEVILSKENLQGAGVPCGSSYQVTVDLNNVIFALNTEKAFRHSTKSTYYYVKKGTSEKILLSQNEDRKQSTARVCTDTTPGNAGRVVYVENNNIFYVDINQSGSRRQITYDGVDGVIFNGVTDWLYEEEIFGDVETFRFSPDCSKLVYMKLDDSKIKEFTFATYKYDDAYPEYVKVRIPAVNESNPVKSVFVYNFASQSTVQVPIDDQPDDYVYDLFWRDSKNLVLVLLDRYYKNKRIINYDTSVALVGVQVGGQTSTTFVKNTRTAYFIPNTEYHVDIAPVDGFYHLFLYDNNQTAVKKLTNGTFDVTAIYRGYNAAEKTIFFQSTEQGSTTRVVQTVNIETGEIKTVTKNSLDEAGEYYSASVSSDGTFYILNNHGIENPGSVLKKFPDEEIAVLEDNKKLKEKLKSYTKPQYKFEEVELKVDGETVKLNALYILPPFFTSSIYYRTLVFVYGGPESQQVSKQFNVVYNPFYSYLASTHEFVVILVDNRGTGFKGVDFQNIVYGKLGEYESKDIIEFGKSLKSNGWTNVPNGLGIYGWSYGGYTTLRTLVDEEGSKTYAYGISGAPVTDWRYYDTAYTERYMGPLTTNTIGYKNSSILTKVEERGDETFKGSGLLLVHGTADENVRTLNSFNLILKLQENDVVFDSLFYPNEPHGLSAKSKRHFYHQLVEKFKTNLKIPILS